MRGIYRFYQGGELIHEGENLITNNGKIAIQRYLAGLSGHFGRSLRLGISSTAASATDTALSMEAATTPVYLISPDFANTALIFKGRVDENLSMVIYEIGLASSEPSDSIGYGSKVLFQFESISEAWSAGTYQTSGARAGTEYLRISPSASTTVTSTLSSIGMDLSGYSDADELKLAYNPGNAFTSSIILRLYTDASNYYSYTIPTLTSGFKAITFSKSNFVATGSPNWANITSAALIVTATAGGQAQVDFELFRVDDKDTYNETEILVSRYIPGTQIVKTVGQPLDIEYTLDLTL